MQEVSINPITLDRLAEAIGAERVNDFRAIVPQAKELLQGRTVWNVNTTAQGGGVAEMLQPILGYVRGLGVDARWVVTEGDTEFFAITKRLHNRLHGAAGDGGDLGEREIEHYQTITKANADRFLDRIDPGDIVILHDPQTAGLIPEVLQKTSAVVWRCHIGHEMPDEHVKQGWRFLMPYLEACPALVFTRSGYIPAGIDHDRCMIIPPSIDPLSVKNQAMSPEVARSILVKTGIVAGPNGQAEPVFLREDGAPGKVQRCADNLHFDGPPAADRRLVVQVSRWDSLKDPLGVIRGFAKHLAGDSASLVLAGPNVSAVADDPEGGQVLKDVEQAWRDLPEAVRKNVHVACLPMDDREENAAIVNALQRHASVVVQKSLYEGFGLTVTEAMWKAKPVVASAVGGIQDQIEDGVSGLLVQDPTDVDEYAHAVSRLLSDTNLAETVSCNARRRVEENFLFTRHLKQYLELFKRLLN